MKRTIYLLAALAGFALLLISVLSSCESNQTQPSGKAPTLSAAPETSAVPLPPEDGSSSIEPEPESVPDEEPGSKILVAYFSRMGNMEFDENVDATTSASVNSPKKLPAATCFLLKQWKNTPRTIGKPPTLPAQKNEKIPARRWPPM